MTKTSRKFYLEQAAQGLLPYKFSKRHFNKELRHKAKLAGVLDFDESENFDSMSQEWKAFYKELAPIHDAYLEKQESLKVERYQNMMVKICRSAYSLPKLTREALFVKKTEVADTSKPEVYPGTPRRLPRLADKPMYYAIAGNRLKFKPPVNLKWKTIRKWAENICHRTHEKYSINISITVLMSIAARSLPFKQCEKLRKRLFAIYADEVALSVGNTYRIYSLSKEKEVVDKTLAPDKTDSSAKDERAPKGMKKVGIIATIIQLLKGASKKKPITHDAILKVLVKRFPDRPVKGMASTVRAQVPKGLYSEKKLKVHQNSKGFWLS